MFDPVTITTAVTTATSAFNAIKRAMDAGREVESISKDLNRWMSAVSDVDNIKKQSENPTFFRKILSGNQIEQMAFESIRAKKALEDQRATLKNYIMFKMGTRFWEDLLAEEGRLRKPGLSFSSSSAVSASRSGQGDALGARGGRASTSLERSLASSSHPWQAQGRVGRVLPREGRLRRRCLGGVPGQAHHGIPPLGGHLGQGIRGPRPIGGGIDCAEPRVRAEDFKLAITRMRALHRPSSEFQLPRPKI